MSSVLTPGRNLVLIGMMGAGKTVVGQLVAARLDRGFIDTDALVEAEAHKPIPEIFANQGERGFRVREAAAIRRASALRGQVIAVGGGAVVDPANVTSLRATGDLVLLDAPPEVLAQRVAEDEDSRPLLAGAADLAARLAQVRTQRGGAYRRAAAHTIDTTGRTPQKVADAVLAWARAQPGLLTSDERKP
ncbi:MAG: shikimate kinase [Egibacteraceae bacterium]